MTTIKTTGALDAINNLDLTSMDLNAEVPYCPKCGSTCRRAARKGIWSCDPCDYSITLTSWDIVMLHSGVLDTILDAENIEHIIYQGVPIPREHAVSPSHLMPLFIATAKEMGLAFGTSMLMLEVEMISDEAAETPSSLLAESVTASNLDSELHESLMLITAAAQHAVAKFREDDEQGGSMDSSYIYDAAERYPAEAS